MSTKNFRSFSEYVAANGKLQAPIVNTTGDTAPDGDKTPKAAVTKGQGWEAQVKSAGKPTSYSSETEPVSLDFSMRPKGEKDGKSFGDDGDKGMIYKPKTTDSTKVTTTWPQTTKEFLDQTKSMSLVEFATFLSERNQVKSALPPASDDPVMATHYATALANANDGIMETLVRDIKRLGCLDRLVAELFKHPESYDEIGNFVRENAAAMRRLERAVNEVVDAPASNTEDAPIKSNSKLKPDLSKTRKNPKAADGQDMKDSGVVTTKATTQRQ